MVGIVQFFLQDKGYGYIRVAATREEFHVRAADLETAVQRGDWVTFEIEERKQGYVAIQVQKCESTK